MAHENLSQKIEKYASLFFTPTEIAFLIDLNPEDFISKLKDKNSMEYKSYMKGKLSSMIAIRENQLLLAKNGSPKSEEAIEKLIKSQNVSETDI